MRIATLVALRDGRGRCLLLRRKKAPNKGLWSPVGGKIRIHRGESPYEGAQREVREETGFRIRRGDLRLFGLVTERGYEGADDWLLFLFGARVENPARAVSGPEGELRWFTPAQVLRLPLPEADMKYFWKRIFAARPAFFALTLECDRTGIRRAWHEE